jgi:ketosteroid isomerase-like protein
MNNNGLLIQKFYTSFQNKDYKGMQECYADNVSFSDNAFPALKGKQAGAMWHMLISGGKDLQLTFEPVKANDTHGSCDWTATYTFSLTGRKVTNKIHAEFDFSNGKIIRHKDSFDFYNWAKQAFGLTGLLLGWTRFFRNKVQSTAGSTLNTFIEKHEEYK